MYDWVDITIRERNICKNVQLDFEERYFSETIRIYQVVNKRYKVQRITNRKNSALLLQLVDTSFVTTANGQATMEVSVLMDLKYVFLTFKNIVHPQSVESASVLKEFLPQWHRELQWKSTITFTRNSIFRIVSLPGEYEKVSLKLQGKIGYENVTFKAQWLHGIYPEYKSNLHKDTMYRCTNLPNMAFPYEFCINYSSSKIYSKRSYLLFKQFFLYRANDSMGGISWLDASKVCTISGRILPVVRSRDEMYDVLGIFKLLKLPPVAAIYIGMNKVRGVYYTKLQSILNSYL